MRHSSPSSTGVLPVLTTCLSLRTAAAGFIGTIWPVMSQSNSMRTAASCCFTPLSSRREVAEPQNRKLEAANRRRTEKGKAGGRENLIHPLGWDPNCIEIAEAAPVRQLLLTGQQGQASAKQAR